MTYERAKELDKLNPEDLTTEKVQYWSDSGTMMTAQMSNLDASKLVKHGKAFVISEQAIGEIR